MVSFLGEIEGEGNRAYYLGDIEERISEHAYR